MFTQTRPQIVFVALLATASRACRIRHIGVSYRFVFLARLPSNSTL